MELWVSQQKPHRCAELPLHPDSARSTKTALSDKAPLGHVEVLQPTRGNTQVQDTKFSPQSNMAPKFIPVFKNRSVQMNKKVLEPGNLKRKQHITYLESKTTLESKLFLLKTSVIQNDKPKLDPVITKRFNRDIQMNARNLNQKTSTALQQKKTESCEEVTKYPPFNRKSSAVGINGSQRLSDSSGFQMSDKNLSVIRSAVDHQVNEKETLTSKYIAQVLGKGHESLKVERPYIFESDTEMEDAQLLQHQSVNQTKETDVSDHSLIESKAAPRSKRKPRQEPSNTVKQPRSSNARHGRSSSPMSQVRKQF